MHAMCAVSISCPKDCAYILAFTMSCRDNQGQVVNFKIFVSCRWTLTVIITYFIVLICEV